MFPRVFFKARADTSLPARTTIILLECHPVENAVVSPCRNQVQNKVHYWQDIRGSLSALGSTPVVENSGPNIRNGPEGGVWERPEWIDGKFQTATPPNRVFAAGQLRGQR